MDRKSFKEHIENEHKMNPLTTYLKEVVYGGNDGIVTTFAVVAGFSGANLGAYTLNLSLISVLLFGIANLIADGAAMGLGSYLSVRSSQTLYKTAYDKEYHETIHSTDYEIEETEFIFQEQGFNKTDAKQLTKIISKNTDFWVKFMVQHECELENPENESALYNGLATFLSFLCFGFIPLIPYFFMTNIETSFYISSAFTVFALALLGVTRAWVTKESMIRSIIETIIIGGLAASLAYIIGTLFKHF